MLSLLIATKVRIIIYNMIKKKSMYLNDNITNQMRIKLVKKFKTDDEFVHSLKSKKKQILTHLLTVILFSFKYSIKNLVEYVKNTV